MNHDNQNFQPLTEVKTDLSEKIQSARKSVSQGISDAQEMTKEAAERISDKADETIHKVADTLNSGGEYLNRHSIDEIQSSLTKLIRRHPYACMAGSFALGVLVVMATTPRH